MRSILLVVLGLMIGGSAFAQTPTTVKVCSNNATPCPPVSATNPFPVTATFTPSGTQNVNITQILGAAPSATNPLFTSPATSAVTGSVAAATITNSSTQVLAAASRKLLAIDNESATATIACNFGGTAAINTAGNFTIPPNFTRVWSSYPVPAEAVNCISSVASSPATVESN